MSRNVSQIRPPTPEADMPPDVFAAIAALAHREAGLMIPETKRALVQSRVSRRLRVLGMSNFRDYLAIVEAESGAPERRKMISVLTTNVSSFFRENHHFETLAAEAPDLLARARAGRKVRIWSAGCSSGQEPCSIAMTFLDAEPRAGSLDLRILASDIDPAILDMARAADYDDSQMAGVSAARRSQYFEPPQAGISKAGPAVRSMISFRELNLLRPWPMKGTFDAIFCRNVVIYFDEATQLTLWPRFRGVLSEGGLLFVGHSERVPDPSAFGFETAGVTTYRAVGAATTGASAPGASAATGAGRTANPAGAEPDAPTKAAEATGASAGAGAAGA